MVWWNWDGAFACEKLSRSFYLLFLQKNSALDEIFLATWRKTSTPMQSNPRNAEPVGNILIIAHYIGTKFVSLFVPQPLIKRKMIETWNLVHTSRAYLKYLFLLIVLFEKLTYIWTVLVILRGRKTEISASTQAAFIF